MEQKRIDELDESFSGEEFIDEEDLFTGVEASEAPQKKKSVVEEEPVKKQEKERKVQKPLSKTKESKENKETKKNKIKLALQKSSKSISRAGKERELLSKAPEITITPVSKNESKPSMEFAAPPVDPWKEEREEKSSGWSEEASTWKAVTGIVVVLLVLSVFTQGFSFSPDNSGSLSLQEAQEKTVTYVNSYLLRPPFTAEATGAEEVDGLYKVTLSVAGEVVDSYLTRDGKLFFPQGFAVAELPVAELPVEELPVEEGSTKENEEGVEQVEQEVVDSEESEEENPAVVEAASEEGPVEAQPAVDATSISLSAKRWLFSPAKVVVPAGKLVHLAITSTDGLSFTFAIPGLDLAQQVDGQATVTFTPTKTGSFDFVCSSCEDWRGMKGTLVVVE